MAKKGNEVAGTTPAASQGIISIEEAIAMENAEPTETIQTADTEIKAATPAEIEAKADAKLAELGATAVAEVLEGTTDEWDEASKLAAVIFEQYKERNEVYITIDAQAFWLEDHAASCNSKYRKFER